MPQIWMTYAEAGELLGYSADGIRHLCADKGLKRRKCSDGNTRLKLPDYAVALYIQTEITLHLERNMTGLGVAEVQNLASLSAFQGKRAA